MTWLLVTRRPCCPAIARLGLVPRHPYSAVPFPSNWQFWLNFPDAMQQSIGSQGFAAPRSDAATDLGPVREPPRQLSVGDTHNMTVSWRRRLAHISGAAGG